MSVSENPRTVALESGLRKSVFSEALFGLYRLGALRKLCVSASLRLEGGNFHSFTLRRILADYHGVRVGAYSYGSCMIPGEFPKGVTVGRYASVAAGVQIFLRNHPMDRLSTHPFFYNKELGFLTEDSIETGTLTIGHDAWVGASAIFTPSCREVGLGAVVGAGAVVTKSVPDFAIVAGNPAKLIRYRFDMETCELIRAGRWWERSVEECAAHMGDMVTPLGKRPYLHPLLRREGPDQASRG